MRRQASWRQASGDGDDLSAHALCAIPAMAHAHPGSTVQSRQRRTLCLSSSVRPGPKPMSQSTRSLSSLCDHCAAGARPPPPLRTSCVPR